MRSEYRYHIDGIIHHYYLKCPTKATFDTWLADMTVLANKLNHTPGDEPVAILIEYHTDDGGLPLRYVVDRTTHWMRTTPRRRTAYVCVAMSNHMMINIADMAMRVYHGTDEIKLVQLRNIHQGREWILNRLGIQSSK